MALTAGDFDGMLDARWHLGRGSKIWVRVRMVDAATSRGRGVIRRRKL